MSKIICSSAIDGAVAWVAAAEAKLDEAVKAKGETEPVAVEPAAGVFAFFSSGVGAGFVFGGVGYWAVLV